MLCRAGPGDTIFPTFWRILIDRNFCFKTKDIWFVGVRWGSLVCLFVFPVSVGSVCMFHVVMFFYIHRQSHRCLLVFTFVYFISKWFVHFPDFCFCFAETTSMNKMLLFLVCLNCCWYPFGWCFGLFCVGIFTSLLGIFVSVIVCYAARMLCVLLPLLYYVFFAKMPCFLRNTSLHPSVQKHMVQHRCKYLRSQE